MSGLLERLRRYKDRDDRGMMANLRCILVENKKHRAWPALSRIGVPINDGHAAFIAGLYATHPEESSTGNFGATCKAIEQKRDMNRGEDSKLTPTERRFQHLLAAENADELHSRIRRMILMAKAVGVPVNYAKLETDLKKKEERRKTEWAASFWDQSTSFKSEEEI